MSIECSLRECNNTTLLASSPLILPTTTTSTAAITSKHSSYPSSSSSSIEENLHSSHSYPTTSPPSYIAIATNSSCPSLSPPRSTTVQSPPMTTPTTPLTWLDKVKLDLKCNQNMSIIDDTDVPISIGSNNTGFLHDLPKKISRSLLATHEFKVKTLKEEMALSEWCRRWHDSEDKNPNNAYELIQTLIQARKRETEEQRGDTNSTSNKKRSFTSTSSFFNEPPSGTSSVESTEESVMKHKAIRINEPYILRMSVYKKTASLLQHYYNEHDVSSIQTFILKQFCIPDVKKTFVFWNALQQEQQQLPSSRMSMYDTRSTPSKWIFRDINLANPMERNQLPCVCLFSLQGIPLITDSCSLIFETVPDSIIVYHTVEVEDYEDEVLITAPSTTMHSGYSSVCVPHTRSKDLVVKASYSFFFKVPIFMDHNNQSTTATVATATGANKSCLVDVEMKGCLELSFSRYTSQIVHITDHVALSSATLSISSLNSNDSNNNNNELELEIFNALTMDCLIKHMGYI